MDVNRIIHGDALDVLRGLPDASVDAIITDPPYGLAGRVFEFPHKHYTAVNEAWDMTIPLDWMIEAGRVVRDGGSVAIFAARVATYTFAAEALRLGWRLVNDITLVKPAAPPNFTGRMMTETTERLLWFCPSGSRWTYNRKAWGKHNGRDVWRMQTPRGDERVHPTQKPLNTLEHLVKLITNEGDLVLDPFAGSGTTLVAARNLQRRYLGVELQAEYVETARKRLDLPYTLPMFDRAASGED